MRRTGILVVGHGSRERASNVEFEQLVAHVQAHRPSIPALEMTSFALEMTSFALEMTSLWIRQVAWLSAAFCTGLGLAIFAFGPKTAKVGGLLFLPSMLFRLLVPVSGSDIPSPALSALEHLFTVSVLGDFLLFWLVLGALSGHLFEQSADFHSGAELT